MNTWHLDQFAHLNVRWFAHHIDDAIWLMWDALGMEQTSRQADHGCHTITAKGASTLLREYLDGDLLKIKAA